MKPGLLIACLLAVGPIWLASVDAALAQDCSGADGINAKMDCVSKSIKKADGDGDKSKADKDNADSDKQCNVRNPSDVEQAWNDGSPFTTGIEKGEENNQYVIKPGPGGKVTTKTGTSSNESTFDGANKGGINSKLLKQADGKGKGPRVVGGPLLFKENYQDTSGIKSNRGADGVVRASDFEKVDIKTETRYPDDKTKIVPTGKTATATTWGKDPIRALINALSDAASTLGVKLRSEMIDQWWSKCKTTQAGEVSSSGKSTDLELKVDIMTPIAGYVVTDVKKTEGGFEVTVEVQGGKVSNDKSG